MRRLLRLHHWWANKIPPALAAAYLAVATQPREVGTSTLVLQVALFVVSCLGIGGLGYLLTDACDVAEDKRLGKANGWASLPTTLRAPVILALLVAAWLPWRWMPNGALAASLVAVEMVLFMLYAVPPVRLKERGLAGIVTDALYAHVLPVVVAWVAFSPTLTAETAVTPALLAAWMLPMGMRHLARHQHDDLDRDRIAQLRTFAVKRGREGTMRFIATWLVPVECAMAVLALAWLAPKTPLLLAGLVAHATWELYVARVRSLAPLPPVSALSPTERHDLFGQRILSTYVERWLAPLALVSLVMNDPRFLWLVPLHLLVAGSPLRAWWHEVRALPRFATAGS